MTRPDDPAVRPTGRHGAAAAAPRPAAAAPPGSTGPQPAAGDLTGRARPAPAGPAALPRARTVQAAPPATPAPAPRATGLDPATAYGTRSAPASLAEPVADASAPAGAEAEWSATALAAGTGSALAAPAVLAEPTSTTQEEAAAQGAGSTALETPAHDDRPPPRGPGRPHRPRRPWTVGGLHLVQLLVWETAVVAVLAVHRQPMAVLVPVVVAAVLAVALTALRLRGRWAWQWLGRWLRFRTRRRRHEVPAGDADVAADRVLSAVLPGGWVDAVEVDGVPAALFDHAGGLSVVVEAAPVTTSPFDDRNPELPALSALLPPVEDGAPRLTAQLLVHTVPAPGAARADDPAAVSYRELVGAGVPARRRCWIALQVQRPPVDADETELGRALVNAVRRVQRQVRRAGLRGHLLSPADARAGLVALADGPVDGPAQVRESWRAWTAGGQQHLQLRLVDWPDLSTPEARTWVDRVGVAAGYLTVVAVAARRTGEDELEVEGTVRLTLPRDVDPAPVVRAVVEAAAAVGGRLRPLDGEQAAGMAATLPLGGFLP